MSTNNYNREFTVDDIKSKLSPMADTVIEQNDTLTYLDSDKEEVARIQLQDDPGSYASVLMDQTGEYTEALKSLVYEVEGVDFRNGLVQVHEPPKIV